MAETSPLVKMVRSVGSAAFEDKCFAVDGPLGVKINFENVLVVAL